jgi:hypothetical protein
VTFPAFKAGDSVLRGSNGGFDFHTPPPQIVKQVCILVMSILLCSVHVANSQPSEAAASTFQMARMALSNACWRSGIHLE